MKKMLMVATVPSMIGQFNMNNISILLDLGYEVHVACNWNDRSVWTQEKVDNLKNKLNDLKVKFYQIDFSRSIFDLKNHFESYKQILELTNKNKYNFIHCHTPIASVITRLVCKKSRIKCIYTAHGFHFYKGAPLINWMIFYPIEKYLSKYTDILITINKEDYNRAKNSFKMKAIEYIPGVGVDIQKFQLDDFDRDSYRKQLGLNKNDFMILSVGELNTNKNHQVILKAIAKLNNPNIKYMIAGKGNLKSYLIMLSKKLRIENQVTLLGFRKDIAALLQSSDLFAFPSKREGLGLAAIEAMASGLPLITSNIQGIKDYLIEGITGYSCNSNDVNAFASNIKLLYENQKKRKNISESNKKFVKKFDKKITEKIMKDIYFNALLNCGGSRKK
ncbi:glycosyltransferase family 4 protein [Massilimicrobiota timonensis]|uniref:Glycosyltransferase family 1 protein n=1 Tax=Massilimicrobiota timonensis TaxID=1776392 RepID=A0A1Y4SXG1_9FIRM|nr:glycosyltransferase family 4 protein [Massilimicrobiota timonensis]OUQ33622.1 hypothetical protein B5E75_09465 [Massilimicrobiota timonensis]